MAALPPHIRKWLNWVLITSHPIRRVDENENLLAIGSATLIDYNSRRFLLTVQHNIPLGSNDWVIDLGRISEHGSEIYKPNSFYYLAEYTRSTGDVKGIDFCFAEISCDINSTYQHRTPWTSSAARNRHVFQTDLNTVPSIEQTYAFAGEIQPEKHAPSSYAMTMTVNPGLKYLKTEGEMQIFKLPVPHPGHDAFRGCSGAPIVDTNQSVVALVCGGSEENGTVFGVSVSRCKFALNFYCSIKQ